MFYTSTAMQNGRMRPYRHTGDMPAPAYKPGPDAVINTEDISDGMVLSCLFNEGTGTVINDKTTSPLTGTLSAGMWDFDSRYGSILLFDTGKRLELPHDSKNNVETFTIAFAFRTSTTAYYSSFIAKGTTQQPYSVLLGWPTAGKLLFQCIDGGVNPYTVASPTYNNGEWHQVVATRVQGGNLNLYVDGTLRGTVVDTSTLGGTLSAANIVIGADGTYGNQYFGQMAYLHMWNRVLSGAPGSVGDPATGEIAAITLDEFLMYR